ncbi:SDR family oxidoreductase [Liberiplasma polymorphum]|jgi:nucleoside-diphosphate-sugar epimerase|uniref:SDR family oxidoreductase n=1 Tax=Liberiplasma polymorphum TaxID=3374570 RepID=UPI0037766147
MKVLVIGGTGIISTFVVKKCVNLGMDVTVMNRGTSNEDLPEEVNFIIGDINNEEEASKLLKDKQYDSVIQFVAFVEEQVRRDIRLFKGKTDQYIFISSASAYHKPVEDYPITENTPLHNPYWEYSHNKIVCENYLNSVKDMNITIVRPSHTYNNKMLMAPMTRWQYDYAHMKRLIEGKPVIMPGDGTNLWTITHGSDFANSFVYLIGNEKAYNDVFHITGEKLYTWEQLTNIIASSLEVEPNIVHIPSDFIIKHMPEMEGPLLGDKSWSAIFDNTKIKSISKEYTSLVGYEDVVDDVVRYFKENKDQQTISDEYEELYDRLIKIYQAI